MRKCDLLTIGAQPYYSITTTVNPMAAVEVYACAGTEIIKQVSHEVANRNLRDTETSS